MRPLDRLILWVGLSNFGTGLVFPYTALFLLDRTSLGAGGVVLFFAVVSVTNFAGGIGLSVVRLSSGPGLVSGIGCVLAALSYAAVAFARGVPAVVAVAVGIGLGRAAVTASNAPLLRAMVPAEQVRAAFGRWYRAMNVGLGLGTLVGTVLVATRATTVLGPLFVVNGISFLPLGWYLIQLRDIGRLPPRTTTRQARSLLVLGRSTVGVTSVQFAVYLLTFSQFEATTPLVAHTVMDLGLGFVSLLVTVNTVAVIVVQKPVIQLLTGRTFQSGVRIAIVCWAVGFALAAVASLLPPPVPIVGLLLFGCVFAVGEAAYACSYSPWLLSSVPDDEATRISSLSNVMRVVGSSSGPGLGVLLMSTGNAAALWAVLAMACGLLALSIGAIRVRSLEPA